MNKRSNVIRRVLRIAELIKEKQDRLKGGLADRTNLSRIAKHYEVPIEHLKNQLKMGIKAEREHTDSIKVAMEIALDHLAEDPNYYTKLKSLDL